jgi:hypothetical protein
MHGSATATRNGQSSLSLFIFFIFFTNQNRLNWMGRPRRLGADDLYALAQSSEPRSETSQRDRAPARRLSGVGRAGELLVFFLQQAIGSGGWKAKATFLFLTAIERGAGGLVGIDQTNLDTRPKAIVVLFFRLD